MPDDHPRLAIVTAGAAGMYCGSCMHDNTLARALGKLGVDVVLIPTYTPIRTDEPDASLPRVFFGGINVYLDQYLPLYRWFPSALVGWLDHPQVLLWASRRGVQTDGSKLGPLCVSMLRGEHGRQRREVLKLIRFLETEIRPQLVCFSNILIAGCVELLRARWRTPIVVMLQGDDLFLDSLPQTFRQQAIEQIQRIDRSVDLYLAHSSFYADRMAGLLHIPRSKIRVIPLGIDVEEFVSSNPVALPTSNVAGETQRAPRVGYLARLAPEKGLHLLCEAVAKLRGRQNPSDVQLHVAGWLGTAHQAYAEEAFEKVRRVAPGALHYVGEVNRWEKAQFLAQLDLLCVPSPYQEPKGLYALEALACKVPIIAPDHGCFPELINATGGGLLFQANSVDDLTAKLGGLLDDAPCRAQLATRGFNAVRALHDAPVAARQFLTAVRKLVPQLLPAEV